MKLIILTLILTMTSLQTFAHGEDIAGPHGGEIRMPGAFHTELVADGKNKIKIYLLDIHFKNPSVDDSIVEVNLLGQRGGKAECLKDKDAFICSFNKDVNLKKTGTLEVKTVHKKEVGGVVTYKTPLKFK